MRPLLLLPLSLVTLAGCMVGGGPAPRPTTTTTYVMPAPYYAPAQSSTTTVTDHPATLYSPATQSTTTTVRPGY
jgi:hypothetical protein